jgi:psp operon transcriptional activator
MPTSTTGCSHSRSCLCRRFVYGTATSSCWRHILRRKWPRRLGCRRPPVFSPRALQTLRDHSWPGNVRELRNAVERAVYRAGKTVLHDIEVNPFKPPFPVCWVQHDSDSNRGATPPVNATPAALPPDPVAQQTESPDLSFSDAVARFELELLRKALRSSKYNQRHAANRLGLTYDQFRGLYRKYRAQLEQSWNSNFPPNR